MVGTVGVVIPAYQPDIDELREYSTAIRDIVDPDEIRIELDDPCEETRAQLHTLPGTVNVAEERRGKGTAITAGFEKLSTDVLSFADADGSTPAADIGRIVRQVESSEADLVIGSRRHPDADIKSMQTRHREFIGDVFVRLAQLLLNCGISDYQCGAKALHLDAWRQVRTQLYEPGFAWDVELIAMTMAGGLRIKEVPIKWEDKPGSTVSPIRSSIQLFTSLLRLRRRIKQLRNDTSYASSGGSASESMRLIERVGKNAGAPLKRRQ